MEKISYEDSEFSKKYRGDLVEELKHIEDRDEKKEMLEHERRGLVYKKSERIHRTESLGKIEQQERRKKYQEDKKRLTSEFAEINQQLLEKNIKTGIGEILVCGDNMDLIDQIYFFSHLTWGDTKINGLDTKALHDELYELYRDRVGTLKKKYEEYTTHAFKLRIVDPNFRAVGDRDEATVDYRESRQYLNQIEQSLSEKDKKELELAWYLTDSDSKPFFPLDTDEYRMLIKFCKVIMEDNPNFKKLANEREATEQANKKRKNDLQRQRQELAQELEKKQQELDALK